MILIASKMCKILIGEKLFPLSGNIFQENQLYNIVMRKNFFKIL